MRFSEGPFATDGRRISYVAYLWYQSSVRGCFAFRLPSSKQKSLAVPMYTDSQACLLPSTKVLRLDDPDFDLWMDVGVQSDRDAVDAESADRLMEIDLTLLDVVALSLELVGDVGSGD